MERGIARVRIGLVQKELGLNEKEGTNFKIVKKRIFVRKIFFKGKKINAPVSTFHYPPAIY